VSDLPPPPNPEQPPGDQPLPPPGGQPLPPPGGQQPPPPGYQPQPPPGGWAAQPAGWQGPPLAEWPQRALAFLIDYFGPVLVAVFVQVAISTALGMLLALAALAWGIYNGYLQGETGQSYGKKQAGIRLLSQANGQPIGGGAGVGRFFVHIVDGIPCYVGFLWPLWDPMKQTFADKIMKTVVIVDQ
jgi:uncharacterized RDD family membrane protein YckC